MSKDAWDNLFAWGDEMVKKYGITPEDVRRAVEAARKDLAERHKVQMECIDEGTYVVTDPRFNYQPLSECSDETLAEMSKIMDDDPFLRALRNAPPDDEPDDMPDEETISQWVNEVCEEDALPLNTIIDVFPECAKCHTRLSDAEVNLGFECEPNRRWDSPDWRCDKCQDEER